MNTTCHSLHTPAPLSALRTVADALEGLSRRLRSAWAAHRERRVAAATFAALAGLDDRTLRDLGFHRSELQSVAHDPHDPTRTRCG